MEESTGITPKALEDQPKLFGYAQIVGDAYLILSGRRSAGMIPNPIQLSEIVAYIQIYGDPDMPIDLFIELIGTVDSKYLEKLSGNKSSGNR